VKFNYYTNSPRALTTINCEDGQLNVIGNLAKFNAPFGIDDVTTAIDYLLAGNHATVNIDDVTLLIDTLLSGN